MPFFFKPRKSLPLPLSRPAAWLHKMMSHLPTKKGETLHDGWLSPIGRLNQWATEAAASCELRHEHHEVMCQDPVACHVFSTPSSRGSQWKWVWGVYPTLLYLAPSIYVVEGVTLTGRDFTGLGSPTEDSPLVYSSSTLSLPLALLLPRRESPGVLIL